jgi:hypothetical protein
MIFPEEPFSGDHVMPRKSVPSYRLHKASIQAPSPFKRQPVSSQTTRGERLISRDGKEEQARLENDRWQGYADLLFKIDVPSKLGACSYEVADTKLPQTTKAGTILQLSLYSEIVGSMQGHPNLQRQQRRFAGFD